MAKVELKTPEEHFEYVRGMVRLSFFFAKKYLEKKFPENSIGEILRDHTPALYHGLNYTDHQTKWDNPACNKILAKADELSHLSAEDFEEEMWKSVEDHARERAEINYPNAVGIKAPASWHCGSLTYDPPNPHIQPGYMVFHIANGTCPYSIFDDPSYLPFCFRLLMKETEVKYDAVGLYTVTWLNSNPRWLKYFPQEWIDNMQKPDYARLETPGWSFGDWGQLVTGRGTINKKVEELVRTEGRLKYLALRSTCSYANMKKHLDENFS